MPIRFCKKTCQEFAGNFLKTKENKGFLGPSAVSGFEKRAVAIFSLAERGEALGLWVILKCI